MSSELRTSFQGTGANLYATIRTLADLTKVWNGSAFVTFADAGIAGYAVALTDEGGDEYAADFPTGIVAGDYRVGIYERAGGSPAITDLRLASYELHWNGQSATSVSTVTLAAYALTDLDSAKRHMRITSSTDDTLITQLINSVSAEIERVTGRQFAARDRRLWLNVKGQRRLVLPNPPLQTVYRLAYGAATALSIQYTGAAIEARTTVYRSPESPDAGGIKLVSYSSTGARTVTDLPFATYASTSALATQIALVSGWTATAVVNVPALNLYPTGGGDAKSLSVTLDYPNWVMDDYSVDHQRGTIEFANWRGGPYGWWPSDRAWGSERFVGGHQGLLCELRSGFETIPDDVGLLCREMVKEAWYSGKQNSTLGGYRIGPYSVTFSDTQQAMVRDRLAPYVLDGFVGAGV